MATEQIEVKLPLSAPTASRLMKAVGAAWPDARIRQDPVFRTLVFEVDSPTGDLGSVPIDEIVVDLDDGDFEGIPADVAQQTEAFLMSMRDGSFEMTSPEWYSKMMLGVFHDILAQHEPSPTNYVEQGLELRNPETDEMELWTVTVCRPGGRSPHQLRTDAEAERDLLRSAVRKLNDRTHSQDLTDDEQAAVDAAYEEGT